MWTSLGRVRQVISTRKKNVVLTVKASVKPFQEGDAISLLEGTPNSAIVMLSNDSPTIIMATVPLIDDPFRMICFLSGTGMHP
jgi:hypothetical protein